MNEISKQMIARWFVLPVAACNGAYYAVALLYARIVHIPDPQPMTLVKMVLSRLVSWAGWDSIVVDLPAEYAADIMAKTELVDCTLSSFHMFTGSLAHPFLYEYFPAYFAAVCVIFSVVACVKVATVSPEQMHKKQVYLRGTKRDQAKSFCRKSRKVKDPAVSIRTKAGSLFISDAKLREHTLIVGATGSGKSQLILSYLGNLVNHPGMRMVAVDRKGEFWGHFGRPEHGDILFNPYDQRGVRWSLFNEINVTLDNGRLASMPDDIKAVTAILFQLASRKGDDLFWYSAAANVVNSAICWCLTNNKMTTADLLAVLALPAADLYERFGTLPPALQAGRQAMGDPKSKQAGSVLSICSTVMDGLSAFSGKDGSWSCREWLKSGKGNLYLSTAGKNDQIFAGVVSLIIDLIGRDCKEFSDNGRGRTRLLVVIDELGSYPPLSTLVWMLTLGRSKGIACIIANQTVEKLKKIYGPEETHNLISNMKTKYIFQLPEPTDAEYMSRAIGAAEVEREVTSRSTSGLMSSSSRDSRNVSRQIVKDVTFMPADLMSLKVGQAVTVEPNLLPDVALLQYLPADVPMRQPEYLPLALAEVRAAALPGMMENKAQEEPAEPVEDDTAGSDGEPSGEENDDWGDDLL